MAKKSQDAKLRRTAREPEHSNPKFLGSLRSQRNVTEQWRLESDLKKCKGQIGLWERNLAKAEEGKARWAGQLSSGNGRAHSILEGMVQDAMKAENMISAFKKHAENLQGQIDALAPDAAKVAVRARGQRALAGQVLARLDIDRKLDLALGAVRRLLCEREALSSKMREAAMSLEFTRSIDLDEERFDRLLRSLPEEMAKASEKFVTWFLGREDGRKPVSVRGGEAVLTETLRSHNAFRTGDCPELTKDEEAEIAKIVASHRPPTLPTLDLHNEPGEVGAVPLERVQWAMLR